MLIVLMKITGISPAHTESSKAAANGALSINITTESMALVAAIATPALTRLPKAIQATAQTIIPASRIIITVRFKPNSPSVVFLTKNTRIPIFYPMIITKLNYTGAVQIDKNERERDTHRYIDCRKQNFNAQDTAR